MENVVKKYKIITYGCQMNIHESEKLAGICESLGYEKTDNENNADLIIFNTCCIRENAEDRAEGNVGILKSLKKNNKNLIIAVGGCMTQQKGFAEDFHKSYPYVDIIFGTHNLEDFKSLLLKKLSSKKKIIDIWESEGAIIEGTPKSRSSYPNAWVNISYGCNNFCTYCIVPFVRGRERSRNQTDIFNEVKDLISKGYKEITLLGQNVNSYGKDINTDFATLLTELDKIEGKYRLRFMSNHPKDFTEDLIKTISKLKHVCHCIHLPVQSGSSKILKLMNRRYTKEDYLTQISLLKRYMPDIAITTDIMVGFPKETEEDFNETLDLVNKAQFSGAFTFVYSKRKGTVAEKMEGQIPEDVSKNRIMRLIDLQNSVNKQKSKLYLNKCVEILCEGFDNKKQKYLGRDEYGRMAYFNSDENIIGQFVNVKITETGGISLIGEIIK